MASPSPDEMPLAARRLRVGPHDLDRVVAKISPPIERTEPIPFLRQAKITAVDTTNDVVTLILAGDTQAIAGCRTVNPSRINVDYAINDWVWVLHISGSYPLVLGGPV